MLLPTGTFVGVPLTLLQMTTLHDTLGHWPALDDMVALASLNACMGHAVYDRDRLRDAPSDDDAILQTTTDGALHVASWMLGAHSADTLPYALALYTLSTAYSDLKPCVAPIKPVFVAIAWMVATYYLPHTFLTIPVPEDQTLNAVADFAQICAWSNVADVDDAEEDAQRGIRTPATRFSRPLVFGASLALILGAIACHAVQGDATWTDTTIDACSLGLMLLIAARPGRQN